MSHKALLDERLAVAPKFNERICKGIAVHDIGRAMAYIDATAASAAQGFPSQVKYCGIRRMTPEEHHWETFGHADKKKRTFSLAKSDLYPVELKFSYDPENGQPKQYIKRMVYLPYVGQGGTLRIAGSMRVIHAVLADAVFTATRNDLFVILARARFTLERNDYVIVENGRRISSYYVFGKIHNGQARTGGDEMLPRRAVTTTGHYLFCKEGVEGAFARYYGVKVKVMHVDDAMALQDAGTHTVYTSQYYQTRQRPADEVFKRYGYVPTELALVIENSELEHRDPRVLITSFFYIVDNFPQRMQLRDVNHTVGWRILLGLIIHRQLEPEGRIIAKMDKHIRSLDKYVDNVSRELLESEGVYVNDIYELFTNLNDTISDRQNASDPGNMWGKYLLVNRYALSGIIEAIFTLAWKLDGDAEAGNLSMERVRQLISQQLTARAFTHKLAAHGEFTSVQFPGDCYLLKHTCVLIRQADAKNPMGGSKGRKQIPIGDPAFELHVSLAECASITNYNKRSPDGRTRANPCAHTDDNNRFIRNPKFIEILDRAAHQIRLD